MSIPRYTTLFWTDATGQGYSIRIDATVSESHAFANTVTDHPVESGVNLTDHVRPNPARLTITGMISNHPASLPEDFVGPAVEQTTQLVDVVQVPRVRAYPVAAATSALTPTTQPQVAVLSRIQPGYAATAKVVTYTASFDRVRAVFDALTLLREQGTLIRVVTAIRDYPSMVIETMTVPIDASTGEALVFDLALKQVRTVDAQIVQIKAIKGKQAKKPITVPEQTQGDNTVGGWLKDRVVRFFGGN